MDELSATPKPAGGGDEDHPMPAGPPASSPPAPAPAVSEPVQPVPGPVRTGPDRPQGRGFDRGRGMEAPVPVRQALEGAPRNTLQPVELPSRAIEEDGQGWIVREAGSMFAGVGRNTRAPLLHLIFALATDPQRPTREIVTPGRTIAALTDDELLELLARARPYRERQDRQEVFPDTRKKGARGM